MIYHNTYDEFDLEDLICIAIMEKQVHRVYMDNTETIPDVDTVYQLIPESTCIEVIKIDRIDKYTKESGVWKRQIFNLNGQLR